MTIWKNTTAGLFAWAAVAASAAPPASADLAQIDRAVAAFAGADTRLQPLDRRLRLAACAAPLSLAWHGRGRTTVRVACPQTGGWQVFVPVFAPAALAVAPGTAAATTAPLIARGDSVAIRIEGRGFALTATGVALEVGGNGEIIRIRPDGGKAPVRARVVAAGLVVVATS